MERRHFLQAFGVVGAAATLAWGARQTMAGHRYYDGPRSDHFDGTRFFNPGGTPLGTTLDALRWQFGGQRATWPEKVENEAGQAVPEERVADLRVTMVGHATMLVQAAGLNILTDPVWSQRASPVSFAGPRRVRAPGIAFERLPPIDLVLLSHNHYDHLDVATLARLKAAHDPLVITPLGNDRIVRDAVPDMRVRTGDWGDRVVLDDEVAIHIEPAHHWSARGLRDRRMALWASFVVETSAGRIYFVGDTGFHRGINYRSAAKKHGGFRLAILPIGAYEPRWFMQGQHQNPDEAVQGMRLANAAYAVGHHFATFQLTDEAIGQPGLHLAEALDRHGVAAERFRALVAGQVYDVPAIPT